MESLSLPKELLWNGKMEPISPSSNSELFPIADSIEEWLFDDDNFTTDILLATDNKILELKTGYELKSSQICNDDDIIIEFLDVKEEQWTDVKTNSPQYLDYNTLETVIEQPSIITKVQNPYDSSDGTAPAGYDATILTQLTPPQSPPQVINPNSILVHDGHNNVKEILDFIAQHTEPSSASTLSQLPLANPSNDSITSQTMLDYSTWHNNGNDDLAVNVPDDFTPFQTEIERETQIVDEIVKSRAKELLDWNDDSESMSSFAPPSTDEEEWTLASPSSNVSTSSSNESPEYGGGGSNDDGKVLSAQHLSKKRPRPYGRCPEDRKSRKKEQNKNAATRYRQKKKQEMESVLGEEQILSQRNDKLKRTLAERKREAKYLKTLIREFYQKNKSK